MKLLTVLALLVATSVCLSLTHLKEQVACCEYQSQYKFCATFQEGRDANCEPERYCCDYHDNEEGLCKTGWVKSTFDCLSEEQQEEFQKNQEEEDQQEEKVNPLKFCCKWNEDDQSCDLYQNEDVGCDPVAYCCKWTKEVYNHYEEEYCAQQWNLDTYKGC